MTGNPRVASCSRCGGNFVQFLRPPGNENWIQADSTTGVNFVFDDQLETSISQSFDQEQPAFKRPTQAAFLKSLPAVMLTETEVEARRQLDPRDPKCCCPICRENFCVVEPVKMLPCSHEFHANCIHPWLENNASCPICRHRLPEAPADGEEVEEESEDLQCLKRPGSAGRQAAAVVGVPTSAAGSGTPLGAVADGTAVFTATLQRSDSDGLDADSSPAVVRCPTPGQRSAVGISGISEPVSSFG